MKTPFPEPLLVVGGYTLDLYCKYENREHAWSGQHPGFGESFYGQTYGECAAAARAAGWAIHRDRTATCPCCR